MRYRSLGKTDLKVSEICHGTWAIGFMWGARDDEQAVKALKQGIERGINFIDTAHTYGQGHSERLIRKVLQEVKTKIIVASKCPPNVSSWPPKPGTRAEEAFPGAHLRKITELSLKNLGVDCLDLQQLHVWRPEWLGQGDWLETIQKLKEEGKIRYFGVSLNDHEPDSGLDLVRSGLIDTVQVIFNLFDQNPRNQLFPLCQKHGVGVLARVPLDEGGLSGKLSEQIRFEKGDWRALYFQGDRLKETLARAGKFNFLVRPPMKSLAQAALKFCLSEAAVSSVLVGMRQSHHVEENTAVSDFEDFNEEALAKVHQLSWPRNFYPKFGW